MQNDFNLPHFYITITFKNYVCTQPWFLMAFNIEVPWKTQNHIFKLYLNNIQEDIYKIHSYPVPLTSICDSIWHSFKQIKSLFYQSFTVQKHIILSVALTLAVEHAPKQHLIQVTVPSQNVIWLFKPQTKQFNRRTKILNRKLLSY